MIRVLAFYPRTDGARFDFDYYLKKHVPMCQGWGDSLGMSISIDRGLGTLNPGDPAPYVAIAAVTFPSQQALAEYLTKFGQQLFADTPNFTSIIPEFQVSEIAL